MFAYQNSADLKLHFAVKSMELMETTRAKMRAPFQRQWPTVVQCTIVYLNRISLLSKHGLNFGNVKFRFLWTRFILYPRLQEKNLHIGMVQLSQFWVFEFLATMFSRSHMVKWLILLWRLQDAQGVKAPSAGLTQHFSRQRGAWGAWIE